MTAAAAAAPDGPAACILLCVSTTKMFGTPPDTVPLVMDPPKVFTMVLCVSCIFFQVTRSAWDKSTAVRRKDIISVSTRGLQMDAGGTV